MDEPNRELFLASKVKLNRARKFIAELEAFRASYLANDPVTGKINVKANALDVIWKPTGLEPGAILGDAIHNLRAALDLMASEMARRNGKSDKNVYFPFSASKESLDDAIRQRCFHKAGKDAVALLRTFEPYRGGNEALRMIHDLDIRDKHSALIVAGLSVGLDFEVTYNIHDPGAGRVRVFFDTYDWYFPDAPLKRKPVIETLKKLVELVDGIIEAFAAQIVSGA